VRSALSVLDELMRLLGIDFGTRRIGAAVSDPRGRIATPLEVYVRRGPERDAQHYRALVRDHEIEQVVIGLPLHVGGGEGESAARAREWGAWLQEVTGVAVVFHDERYTTLDAEEVLRTAGVRLGRRAAKRDMLAAQILLQHYLDATVPPALESNEIPGEPA
jgi:putative Holliday junction resolvase